MIWYLSAFYRAQMLLVPSKRLQANWGEPDTESPETAEQWQYRYAYWVARDVYRVTGNTKWESKCLVQAQIARYFLRRKKIQTTMYLGVGKDENGKMIAHAWLRCGEVYVTGGDGKQYATVAKFCQ